MIQTPVSGVAMAKRAWRSLATLAGRALTALTSRWSLTTQALERRARAQTVTPVQRMVWTLMLVATRLLSLPAAML